MLLKRKFTTAEWYAIGNVFRYSGLRNCHICNLATVYMHLQYANPTIHMHDAREQKQTLLLQVYALLCYFKNLFHANVFCTVAWIPRYYHIIDSYQNTVLVYGLND